MAQRLLVRASSRTAAVRINGITIHTVCNVSVDSWSTAARNGSSEKQAPSLRNLRVIGHSRMDRQEKDALVVDEISMLGARTLHAVNEQLCTFHGCAQDFGGIPKVLFLSDFRQFRPVQERSTLVPSNKFSWNEGRTFKVEQRYQHDKAHML